MKARHMMPVLAIAALAVASLSGCGSDQVTTSSAPAPSVQPPAAPPAAPSNSANQAPPSQPSNNEFAAGEEASGEGISGEGTSGEGSAGAAGEPANPDDVSRNDRVPPSTPPGGNATNQPPANNNVVASANVGLEIGNVAPEIVGKDIDGVAFKLSDYRGKVVVLDFWGDW